MIYCVNCDYVVTRADVDARKCPHCGKDPAKEEIDDKRYEELMCGNAKLTTEEMKSGWHFCCEWDELLIHPTWPEAICCRCRKPPEVVR